MHVQMATSTPAVKEQPLTREIAKRIVLLLSDSTAIESGAFPLTGSNNDCMQWNEEEERVRERWR